MITLVHSCLTNLLSLVLHTNNSQAMPYYVRIARFMPRVEIVQKHNSTVRRLYIQGNNGKVRGQGCTWRRRTLAS